MRGDDPLAVGRCTPATAGPRASAPRGCGAPESGRAAAQQSRASQRGPHALQAVVFDDASDFAGLYRQASDDCHAKYPTLHSWLKLLDDPALHPKRPYAPAAATPRLIVIRNAREIGKPNTPISVDSYYSAKAAREMGAKNPRSVARAPETTV
jgi:hypothetical protein